MNYLLPIQNPRPRVSKVKLGSKFALLLAICIWLLYQINPSHDDTEHYAWSLQRKLGGAFLSGCKVNVGWFSNVRVPQPHELSKSPEKAKDESLDLKDHEIFERLKEEASSGSTSNNRWRTDKEWEIDVNKQENDWAIRGREAKAKNETEDGGVHRFDDVNGVPQDVLATLQDYNFRAGTTNT